MEAKSNASTAIPERLALLDLPGCLVKEDAIGSQTAMAAQIGSAHAHYREPVKENQGTWYEDRQLLLEGFAGEN